MSSVQTMRLQRFYPTQKGLGEQLATRLRAGDIDDHRNFRTHQLARTRFGRCLLASFVSYLLFS